MKENSRLLPFFERLITELDLAFFAHWYAIVAQHIFLIRVRDPVRLVFIVKITLEYYEDLLEIVLVFQEGLGAQPIQVEDELNGAQPNLVGLASLFAVRKELFNPSIIIDRLLNVVLTRREEVGQILM